MFKVMHQRLRPMTMLGIDFWQRQRQLLVYGMIGVTALGLEVSLFYLLVQRLTMAVALANLLAMSGGLVFAFTLNARINFRVQNNLTLRLVRYVIVTTGGYFLSTGIVLGLVQLLDLTPLIAKLFSLPAFFVFQYTCHRHFTFRK